MNLSVSLSEPESLASESWVVSSSYTACGSYCFFSPDVKGFALYTVQSWTYLSDKNNMSGRSTMMIITARFAEG
jgi:hypothetical protein